MTSSLADFLENEIAEPQSDEDRAAWRIEGLGQADWAMRKLSALRRAQAEARAEAARQKAVIEEWIHAQVAEQVTPIEEWLAAELERHARSADFFEFHLTAWWGTEIDDRLAETAGVRIGEPGWQEAWAKLKDKSRSLPCGGAVKARKHQDRWEFDDQVFVDWAAKTATELVEVRIVPRKTDAKQALTVKDGKVLLGDEIVPGVTVEPGEVEITVEVIS